MYSSKQEPDVSQNNKVCESDISYDSKDHLAILLKLHGSVWQDVVGFCLVNSGFVGLIYYLRDVQGIDITFKDKGHSFMGVLVSFLVVSRSKIVYNRYMHARKLVGRMFQSCVSLIQNVIILTKHDESHGAKMWRRLIAREVNILLSITVGFLTYRSQGMNVWDSGLPMDEEITKALKHLLETKDNEGKDDMRASANLRTSNISVGEEEVNSQAPILLVYKIRKLLAQHKEYLKIKIEVPLELQLFNNVENFVSNYYELKKLITTPFPFPLVQMARTFLFFWVFTFPCALVHDMGNSIVAAVITIFFLTYGYVGLEFVSMEMDDPFGDDPNDLKLIEMKVTTLEDIYLLIFDANGVVDATRLRNGGARLNLFDSVIWSAATGKLKEQVQVDDLDLTSESISDDDVFLSVEDVFHDAVEGEDYDFKWKCNEEGEESLSELMIEK